MIELAKIRTDGGTQSRAQIHEETVAEYAEAMADPDTVFPPCIVYYDGKSYWLADGFHRVAAWARVGRTEVPAEVRQGDRRRAMLHSAAANKAHGLRRSREDRRRAIMMMLEDEEWGRWSDREIARHVGASPTTVSKYRSESVTVQLDSEPRTYTTKHGTEATMNTAKIGKPAEAVRPPAESAPVPEPQPDHQPTGAEPEPKSEDPQPKAPDTLPDPHAKERKELSKLSREGLEDEVIGLRADLQDEKAKRKAAQSEVKELKAQLKAFDDLEGGRALGNARRALRESEGRSKEHQANAARLQRQVNAQKTEIDRLRKQLEGQEIPL
ncbi:ParB N-terminal domain-containing protein [Pseudooceanicola atlanticus]|uniref:ParB N-terminal domain-containing protein n=1 Tax=Pseudooceanicola atlanticus TaxID=1461694 RepID=UPI00069399B5|nr:ParB N-terminal domain-containing protein [Pseudooceanicola atlanticus]